MQKSFLALLVSSLFLLSGCNEKETQALTQKLQTAEQTITQLKADIAKSQQELTAYQAEVEKAKSNIPYLDVEIVPFFKRDEHNTNYLVSLPKTKFEWLDNLVARQIVANFVASEDPHFDVNKINPSEKEDLIKLLEKNYQADVAVAKEMFGESSALHISQRILTYYLGQRGKIASFNLFHNYYGGGAHNVYSENYVNIDVDSKKVITLDDLVSSQNQAKLKELLWGEYLEHTGRYSSEREPFVKKEDFELTDNFFFTEWGITFSYPPYAIGPFVEGTIELSLPWEDVNPLIHNKSYQGVVQDTEMN